MIRFMDSVSLSTSKPPTVPLPPVGIKRPQSIRMVVDLPAPFGPRKPNISPFFTCRLMLSTATKAPKVRLRSRTTTAHSVGDTENLRGRCLPVRRALGERNEHVFEGGEDGPAARHADPSGGEAPDDLIQHLRPFEGHMKSVAI